MNSFDFLEKLNGISPEFIDESLSAVVADNTARPQSLTAASSAEQIQAAEEAPPSKPERSIFRTAFAYVSLAACVMLAVGAAFLFHRLHGDDLRLLESSRTEETVVTSIPKITAATGNTETTLQTTAAESAAASTSAAVSTQESASQTMIPLITTEAIITEAVTDTEAETDSTSSELTQATMPTITEITKNTAETETMTVITEADTVTLSSQIETDTQPAVSDAAIETTTTVLSSEPPQQDTVISKTELASDLLSLGDLDSDGLLTIADGAILYCIQLRENLHGTRFVSDEIFLRADLNKDGVVNYADQVALMRYLALFWYGGYRDLTLTDYLADLKLYNDIYNAIDRENGFPNEFFRSWEEISFVLTYNEAAMSKDSTLTYETRSPESEEALEVVRNQFRAKL